MILRLIFAAAWLAALSACGKLPENVERPRSHALTDTLDTRLGRALAPAMAANPGKTGVLTLADGRDAFAARALLANAAQRSLDVQYYIYHDDTSGGLLAAELWRAAERGVRVRVLLDDANSGALDAMLAALDAHPNIEVRLFNPFASRHFRVGDLASFARLNRRMHNKAYIADNQVAVLGGRNVGDEYFGGDSAVEFADLDALLAGAVVPSVSAQFDEYWNSPSAYPVASLLSASPAQIAKVHERWRSLAQNPAGAKYLDVVQKTTFVTELLSRRLRLEWVRAHVFADSAAKVLHPPARREFHMLPRLEQALGMPATELDLVSAYFVPTKEGTATLRALAERGVKVRVLTNSLAATDVSPVYAGYVKYREPLLRAGIRLYELKPSGRPASSLGSSQASLHAKTFAVDRNRIFIGSFNFDPRSARLNTENGVVLESAGLAERLAKLFDDELARRAYDVRLAKGGGVEWIEHAGSAEVRRTSTPEASLPRRLWVGFLSLLPIEWLL